MRRITTAFIACLMMLFFVEGVLAQDEITDADLKDYAIILLAQKSITDKISPMVNDLIAKQEGMTGQRFQEISKGTGDPAQEWETTFVNAVNKRVEKRKKAAKTVFNTLASNALGASKFKAIRAALKSDAEMKAKVDVYIAALGDV